MICGQMIMMMELCKTLTSLEISFRVVFLFFFAIFFGALKYLHKTLIDLGALCVGFVTVMVTTTAKLGAEKQHAKCGFEQYLE